MKNVSEAQNVGLTVRVKSIRSDNPKGYGGCIFSGDEVNAGGNVKSGTDYVVVKAPASVLNGTRVERGQWWQVEGSISKNSVIVNGYRLTERQIQPEAMQLARPSGEHVVRFLADNAAFVGVGEVKARRLWDRFGDELYDILDRADVHALASILKPGTAQQLVTSWRDIGHTRTLRWLQERGFDIKLGRKLIQAFGATVREKIEEDPYRLLSFQASWICVDALAQTDFKVAADDPRRLQGAVEESLYRLFDEGHTCAPVGLVAERLRPLLGNRKNAKTNLIDDAIMQGKSNGSYLVREPGTLHLVGGFVMEREVGQRIADLLATDEVLLFEDKIASLVPLHEQAEGITLNSKQKEALRAANRHRFAVVTGGAGVGKTTTLKALHALYRKAHLTVFQVALSGRAARRMVEATGRDARTLAGFVRSITSEDLKDPCVAIVDEASMVDLPTMYRLVRKLPSHCRLVMVGDPHQLPPVGTGLILHELFRVNFVPMVELTQVHRHGSAIATFARAVRYGEWSEQISGDTSAPVAFVRCADNAVNETVLALYAQDPGNSQILSATRNAPHGGNKVVNQLCQHTFTKNKKSLEVWNFEFEMPQGTGFRVGDPVICTRNLWDFNLQNGSLGRLESIGNSPTAGDDDQVSLGWARWDNGELRPVTEALLEHLDLAYSITVHKSQGSQFARVIVPITKSRILDRTLLYTAVTRARKQVVLVGDEEVARAAVVAPPKAQGRHVALGSILKELVGGVPCAT